MTVRDRLALTRAVAVDHGAREEELADWLATPLFAKRTPADLEAWATDEAWLAEQEQMMAEFS